MGGTLWILVYVLDAACHTAGSGNSNGWRRQTGSRGMDRVYDNKYLYPCGNGQERCMEFSGKKGSRRKELSDI